MKIGQLEFIVGDEKVTLDTLSKKVLSPNEVTRLTEEARHESSHLSHLTGIPQRKIIDDLKLHQTVRENLLRSLREQEEEERQARNNIPAYENWNAGDAPGELRSISRFMSSESGYLRDLSNEGSDTNAFRKAESIARGNFPEAIKGVAMASALVHGNSSYVMQQINNARDSAKVTVDAVAAKKTASIKGDFSDLERDLNDGNLNNVVSKRNAALNETNQYSQTLKQDADQRRSQFDETFKKETNAGYSGREILQRHYSEERMGSKKLVGSDELERFYKTEEQQIAEAFDMQPAIKAFSETKNAVKTVDKASKLASSDEEKKEEKKDDLQAGKGKETNAVGEIFDDFDESPEYDLDENDHAMEVESQQTDQEQVIVHEEVQETVAEVATTAALQQEGVAQEVATQEATTEATPQKDSKSEHMKKIVEKSTLSFSAKYQEELKRLSEEQRKLVERAESAKTENGIMRDAEGNHLNKEILDLKVVGVVGSYAADIDDEKTDHALKILSEEGLGWINEMGKKARGQEVQAEESQTSQQSNDKPQQKKQNETVQGLTLTNEQRL